MYKIMIVDDEPVIRKGILCFIDWPALDCQVVCEAGNGIDAKNFLESKQPDIVISDIKMPGMDGIELSKYICENHPDMKVIILTAFTDFSYAQTAIKYDVVDFVIKTNYAEKIPEAICKAKELLRLQEEQDAKMRSLEEMLSENLPEMREKFIKDVINGIIINAGFIDEKLHKFKIALNNFFIVFCEINTIFEEGDEPLSEELNKFIFAVRNFLSLAFKDYQHYIAIMKKNVLINIVCFENSNPSICIQSLLLTCNEILAMADNFMNFRISIGISGQHNLVRELIQAYNEAQEAVANNFYNDNIVSVYNSNPINSDLKPIQIYQYADEIISGLQQGNHTNEITVLSSLFNLYKCNKVPIEQIKVSSIILCSLCFRLLNNYKLELADQVKNETNVYRQIQEVNSIQSLFNIVSIVIEMISKLIISNQKQDNYLVKEVNIFIRENFNKAINLQIIADHVHVNSCYLSRLYKKETGESIVDVLNKHRIEVAKKLLKDPHNKIFEVAFSVGIEDPAYFTHVFTKYTGISPKEYKAKA